MGPFKNGLSAFESTSSGTATTNEPPALVVMPQIINTKNIQSGAFKLVLSTTMHYSHCRHVLQSHFPTVLISLNRVSHLFGFHFLSTVWALLAPSYSHQSRLFLFLNVLSFNAQPLGLCDSINNVGALNALPFHFGT